MKMKKLLALAMVACLSAATYSVGFAGNGSDGNSRRPLSAASEAYYASLEAKKTANGTVLLLPLLLITQPFRSLLLHRHPTVQL